MTKQTGVAFPTASTSALGRTVLASALRKADPIGARAVEHDTNWHRGYLTHFRRAVEAGLFESPDAHSIAADGLRSLYDEIIFRTASGDEWPLGDAPGSACGSALHTVTIDGTAEAERELSIPYRGERLRGDALHRQLTAWVDTGIITASCADAVRTVQDHPQWLKLEGDTVAILGAGAEMGPLQALLRWGAHVAAIDLPGDTQKRLHKFAEEGAGRVYLPARTERDAAGALGADIVEELPSIARWLGDFDRRLVLGNYCYADGAAHVLVSAAGDALGQHLIARHADTALAFLATPTDVFAVPAEDVQRSTQAYERRSLSKFTRSPLRFASGGRLLQRNYPPGADPGVCDSLVPQQGPNYAFAKRIQRWRATTARANGTMVSLNVAPATRTRSVLKNKALAAAYAGAHRFGVEVFDPSTSNTLMAALLVYDLRTGEPAQRHTWQDEARHAAHGGLWTSAYQPRSALGLAAVLGIGSLRS